MSAPPSESSSQIMPSELQEIVDGGWTVGADGVFSLTALHDHGIDIHAGCAEPSDVEYHLNDIWIPGDDLPDDRQSYLAIICVRAIKFAVATLATARGMTEFDTLTAVVSTGVEADWRTHGTTVKFFTRRGGYRNRFEDLESFELEAVALLEAPDALIDDH